MNPGTPKSQERIAVHSNRKRESRITLSTRIPDHSQHAPTPQLPRQAQYQQQQLQQQQQYSQQQQPQQQQVLPSPLQRAALWLPEWSKGYPSTASSYARNLSRARLAHEPENRDDTRCPLIDHGPGYLWCDKWTTLSGPLSRTHILALRGLSLNNLERRFHFGTQQNLLCALRLPTRKIRVDMLF